MAALRKWLRGRGSLPLDATRGGGPRRQTCRDRNAFRNRLVPQTLEAPCARARVARRVLDVLVAEVVLNQPQVGHLT